jgi:predicted TIM-barrel enzyme
VTGTGVDAEQLRAAKDAVGDEAAVIANTGVRPDTVGEMLGIADACIVGTSLKRDGNTWNEVDAERVERLVTAAAESGHWEPAGHAAVGGGVRTAR